MLCILCIIVGTHVELISLFSLIANILWIAMCKKHDLINNIKQTFVCNTKDYYYCFVRATIALDVVFCSLVLFCREPVDDFLLLFNSSCPCLVCFCLV